MGTRRTIRAAFSIAAICSLAGLAGYSSAGEPGEVTGKVVPVLAQPAAGNPPAEVAEARQLSKAFRYVAKTAEPSVVHINALNRVVRRDFFGRIIEQGERLAPAGVGSGVIISADGNILTNNHVVAEADALRVHLHDGREYDAKVIGRDRATDLAVIRVEADSLKPAILGDSDALEVGDWVVAVGNPFGFDNTVTTGIVSAKGRALSGSERANEDFIQTDAAINPGNSGGPLYNLDGHVIGINSAIATRNGGSVGLGFAIPSNIARYVAQTLLKQGRVERGYLGIDMAPLSSELATSAGIRPADGIAVRSIVPDSPAERAGLKPGDVILKYQGRPIDQVYRMRTAIALTPPNTEAVIDVLRGGKPSKVTVLVGDKDQVWLDSLGMKVKTLAEQDARRLGYRGVEGVLVTNITKDGRAARSDLQDQDVIVEVNRQPVTDADEFYRLLSENEDQNGVRLSVLRGGESGWLVLRQ
ncbi:MAG: Do family serine endopeptidase [Phycisphaerales bacterium]|nr:Do family serine endopeptidase [Phycisphaerales bacterium]